MMALYPLSSYALAQINSSPYRDASHIPGNYERSLPSRLFGGPDNVLRSRLTTTVVNDRSTAEQPGRAYLDRPPPGETPIPISSKVLHKFYEPVILLVSLEDAISPQSSSTATSDSSPTGHESDLQVFKAFVNKLSHVCSSAKGPETVTSFVVLRDSSTPNDENIRVHYWFAINEQTRDRLTDTQIYVKNLLSKVGRAPSQLDDPEGWEGAKREIFRDVLVFNRPRITTYLRALRTRANACLERLHAENTRESRLLATEIEGVIGSDTLDEFLGGAEGVYLNTVQTTTRHLLHLEKSESYHDELLRRAEAGRLMPGSSQECFSELVHTSKRILAYPQSVQYILAKARPRWPELFNSPLVSFLPSSKPIPRPHRQKSYKAESIVGRMTRKEKEMRIFRDFVKRLQAFDLDERIRIEYDKDSFTPRVHSEVLLLSWLWENYGVTTLGPSERKTIDPSVFFNGWMYIGSSKPTCRLCHYYFEERRSGVKHRDSHMNLYPAWAFPEVFPSQGEDALLDRQVMLDRVLQRVRKEAFAVVRKKVSPQYKAEDSNTFSEAVVTLDDRWTILSRDSDSDVDVDEITSMMGEMGTGDRGDDDDDETGGARL